MPTKPLNRQPQYYPTVNYGHPLARGLVMDIMMRDSVAVDLARRLPPTASGLATGCLAQGRGQVFSGTGYQMGSGIVAAAFGIDHEISLWSMQSSTPSTEMACIAFAGDFAGPWLGFYAGHPIFFWQTGAGGKFAYANTVSSSGLYQLAGTYNRVSGVGTVYGDGVALITDTSTIGGDLTGIGTTVGIGAGTSGATPFTGNIYHQRVWNRCLLASEVKALKDNPWQIYSAPSLAYWAEHIASGGAAQFLTGAFFGADEVANIGSIAATISLSGANAKTDESANAGTVARGAVALAGANITTDERQYIAALLATISLGGSTVVTDEAMKLASLALGAVSLAGQFAATDEKPNAGAITAAIGLAGQNSTTDEKSNAGALAAVISITGQYSATDEAFNLATITRGAINLAGQFSVTDERSFAGATSTGTQLLAGAFIGTDEAARNGTVTPAAIALSGVFFATDEAARAGSLALLATLSGQGILTDEQFRLAVATVGAVSLGGQAIKTDENTPAAQVQSLIGLLGASIKTDESTLPGVLAQFTNILGSAIKTDESTRINVVTIGGITLIGQFSASDETAFLSIIINGVLFHKMALLWTPIYTGVNLSTRIDTGIRLSTPI